MSTEAIAGANNKLNSIKGFSRILSVSAEEKVAFADKVFPRNILIKADDGDLYLTDGVTALGELEPLKVQSSRDDIGRVISETYTTKAENAKKADDSAVVHKTGDETINGLKTFSYWQFMDLGLNVRWITGNKEQQALFLYGSMDDKYLGFGSVLELHGDGANYGTFALVARDKTNTNAKCFIGMPDGTLTWCGNTVLTEGNGVTTNTAQMISGNKTFTGTVLLQNHNVAFKSTTLDLLHDTTDTWATMGLSGKDKNDKRVGFIDWWAGKYGNCDFRIFCRDRNDNEREVLLAGVKNGVTYVATGGKNMVRSINGQVADTYGNINYNISNDLRTVNADTAIGSIRLLLYRGVATLAAMSATSGGNLSLISIALSAYDDSVEVQYGCRYIVPLSTMSGAWQNIGPSVDYGYLSLFIRVA